MPALRSGDVSAGSASGQRTCRVGEPAEVGREEAGREGVDLRRLLDQNADGADHAENVDLTAIS